MNQQSPIAIFLEKKHFSFGLRIKVKEGASLLVPLLGIMSLLHRFKPKTTETGLGFDDDMFCPALVPVHLNPILCKDKTPA